MIDVDREFFGTRLGLERISAFLALLGHPENNFPSVHVAGTNGKGSTAMMIARILEADGLCTGLFTSPHMQELSERFQINGRPISRRRLKEIWERTRRAEGRFIKGERLSFFEFVTACAFQFFAEEGVDAAVIEVGLGGRLDATNVLRPKVSVITRIGYDHKDHLGSTLAQIAREKGGIIKQGIPVVSAEQREGARRVLEGIARELEAPLTFVRQPVLRGDGTFSGELFQDLWTPALGPHQALNAMIAATASRIFRVKREAIYRGLQSSFLPGRMEIASRKPLVVLDGAHNPDAMERLASSCPGVFGRRRVHCLFGVMADKDVDLMLRKLGPLVDTFHITAPRMKRALQVDHLLSLVKKHGLNFYKHACCGEALDKLMPTLKPDEALLVTGSFFLVGEAKTHLARTS